jgi:signal transduction histidine kinase
LLNLILNAVEASPSGEVKVSLDSDGRLRQAIVRIEDDGPGLGDQDPEELFQPFKTTKLKGSGLGLAVSRRIVQRLGGRIKLENAPEGGTVCTIEVPTHSP